MTGQKAMIIRWIPTSLYDDAPARKALERQVDLELRLFVVKELPSISEVALDHAIERDWTLMESDLPPDAEGWSPPTWLFRTWAEV